MRVGSTVACAAAHPSVLLVSRQVTWLRVCAGVSRIVDEPADERSDRLTVEAATATPWLLAQGARTRAAERAGDRCRHPARVQAQFGPGEGPAITGGPWSRPASVRRRV